MQVDDRNATASRLVRTPLQASVLVAGFALVIGTAVVHGLWTNCWSDDGDLDDAVARLKQVPLPCDHWLGKELELDEETVLRARVAGYLRRSYTSTESGQSVSIVLMCGRFGPMSVHTPDVCYGGAGYEMHGRPVRLRVDLGDVEAEFWTASFQKPHDPAAPPLRLFWGWSAGDGWQAPDNPRWTFRRQPVLFKLYAARAMITLDESLDADTCLTFLRAWLPGANGVLFNTEQDGSCSPIR